MKTYTVYQAKYPTFNLAEAPARYRVVARGVVPDEYTDLAACERAFLATNTIERPWFEDRAKEFGLTVVKQACSISVGDIVEVSGVFYVCAPVGWKPSPTVPLVTA